MKKTKIQRVKLFLALFATLVFAGLFVFFAVQFKFIDYFKTPTLRIGYFLGGRTMLIYRAFIDNYFEKEKLNIVIVTKQLNSEIWMEYDQTNKNTILSIPKNARATGNELFKLTKEKFTDMAFVGEASFLKACTAGEPIVAIAQLGADEGDGGHAIVIKKGIKIKGPKDLEKIVWGSRRSSGGDDIFLKEFLLKEGVDLSKVKFIFNIDDDKINKFLKSGKIQGAYHHLMHVLIADPLDILYVYRSLNWVNPAVSQALAVVTREYYENNRSTLKKFIRAYMKRTAYEHSLPKKARSKGIDYAAEKPGYKMNLEEMEVDYNGMNLPQYPKIPTIRKSINDEAVDMFYRHGFIDKKVDLTKCYDNSLVKEVAAEMYPGEPLPD